MAVLLNKSKALEKDGMSQYAVLVEWSNSRCDYRSLQRLLGSLAGRELLPPKDETLMCR